MILHLVALQDWRAAPADQPYTPKAFATDGFIHCTAGDALLLTVANAFYRQQPGDFVAVAIDEARVTAPVKWEAPASPKGAAAPPAGTPLPPEVEAEVGAEEASMTLFPHIYGPLNRDAILGMRKMVRAADGAFTGFAPLEDPPPQDAANPMNLKPASQLANELVDATDEFSKSLDRYKDAIEARMAEIDKKIKKL